MPLFFPLCFEGKQRYNSLKIFAHILLKCHFLFRLPFLCQSNIQHFNTSTKNQMNASFLSYRHIPLGLIFLFCCNFKEPIPFVFFDILSSKRVTSSCNKITLIAFRQNNFCLSLARSEVISKVFDDKLYFIKFSFPSR